MDLSLTVTSQLFCEKKPHVFGVLLLPMHTLFSSYASCFYFALALYFAKSENYWMFKAKI